MIAIQGYLYVLIHAFLMTVIITVVVYEIQLRCSKLKAINTSVFSKSKSAVLHKTIEKSHVVEALLIDEKIDPNIESENNVIATYMYTWNNICYRKEIASNSFGAPPTIYLLFDEDPRCAETPAKLCEDEFDIVKMFMAIFLVTYMLEAIVYF